MMGLAVLCSQLAKGSDHLRTGIDGSLNGAAIGKAEGGVIFGCVIRKKVVLRFFVGFYPAQQPILPHNLQNGCGFLSGDGAVFLFYLLIYSERAPE